MRKAVVIGSNGQDGTFLVKHLLDKNYAVLGIGRQDATSCAVPNARFTYIQSDLTIDHALLEPLRAFEPEIIFHVAAVHTSAGGEYESVFEQMLKVNVGSVHTILEYLRAHRSASFMYASSAKVFGVPLPAIINADTPKLDQCLYSITKNAAKHLIDYYQKQYDLKTSVVYLFNHESELRPDNFFIPKVLDCLAKSIRDAKHMSEVYTLDFFCDWGSAEEYMEIVIEMLERFPGESYVLGSGTCSSAAQLVKRLFLDYGLNYQEHFLQKKAASGSPEQPYLVDVSKLSGCLNRVPHVSIYEVCKTMLASRYGM